MSFGDVSRILFSNQRFWQALSLSPAPSGGEGGGEGGGTRSTSDTLRTLHSLLSLSGTLREDLLEQPVSPDRLLLLLAAAKKAKAADAMMEEEADAPPLTLKQKKDKWRMARLEAAKARKARRLFVAKADELLFKQPESILHRAVHTLFAYDRANSFATSMSATEAARRFAVSQMDVNRHIEALQVGARCGGRHAARRWFRITVIDILGLALARHGGLARVAAVAAARARTQARALAKRILLASNALKEKLRPLVREVRALLEDAAHEGKDKKRLRDRLDTLEMEMRLLRRLRNAFRGKHQQHPNADDAAGARILRSAVARAQAQAKRVEHARWMFQQRVQLRVQPNNNNNKAAT
jgi:hypothetical protein